jgi:hypothetical protein
VLRRGFNLCVSVSLLLGVSVAHAYRNPERFGASVAEGGGGGRYFTLSHAEGYGCAACHSRGAPVAVNVRSLPAGFTPGQAYRITVDWPDDEPAVALNVEMTTNEGAPFGQLLAADVATLTAADLCRGSDAPSAGQSVSNDATRRVLLVAECGQAQTTFDWIAPVDATHGSFSASITFSNRDGKLRGDRVVDITESFAAQFAAREGSVYRASCSVSSGARASGSAVVIVSCCLCVLIVCQRVRRSKRTLLRTAYRKVG